MAGVKSKHAGNIQKRGENSYYLTYSSGRGQLGKRKRYTRTVHVRNERGAEIELAKFITEIDNGHYTTSENLTFEEFINMWRELHVETNLEPKTFYRYEQLLQRITPALGHIKLKNLEPEHFLQFYKNLQEDGIRKDGKKGGLSTLTINHHRVLISSILEKAFEWNKLSYNPALRAKSPPVVRKEVLYYNAEQTLDLLLAIEDEPIMYKMIVILALVTGLRSEELIALLWNDFDYKNMTVSINKAYQYTPSTGMYLKGPKNVGSYRTLALPECLMPLIWEYEAWQVNKEEIIGSKWIYTGHIFTGIYGDHLFINTPTKWFNTFLERKNLPHITLHGLRHTNATLLLSNKVDYKTVSKRLGHAKTSTTVDIYAHWLKEVDRESAETLNDLFKAALTKQK